MYSRSQQASATGESLIDDDFLESLLADEPEGSSNIEADNFIESLLGDRKSSKEIKSRKSHDLVETLIAEQGSGNSSIIGRKGIASASIFRKESQDDDNSPGI